jgi:hypothetical protein
MPLSVDAASCRVGQGFDAYGFATGLPAQRDAPNTATSGPKSWGFAVAVSFTSRYAKRQDAASTFPSRVGILTNSATREFIISREGFCRPRELTYR